MMISVGIHCNDKIKTYVTDAMKKYKTICDSLAIHYILTDGIGKNLCKKHAISPDAVMQLGFQVGYIFRSILQFYTYYLCFFSGCLS